MNNHRVRKITVSTGIITTFAGSSTVASYSGDNGQATAAGLNHPTGVTLDTTGNVYIADSDNNRIRKVTVSTGIITTIAGTGSSAYSGDNGQATSATVKIPQGVALDTSGKLLQTVRILIYLLVSYLGNVYIADTFNHVIRKVTVSTGIITTLAGTGSGGYSSDNVPATSANLYDPTGLVVDSAGNVYIADYDNHRIRKVTVSTGIITTVAGTGSQNFGGDGGAATSAILYYPSGITLDAAGNIYIADSENDRIRKVTVSTGIITTIAGGNGQGFSGDNSAATSALLYFPRGLILDSTGTHSSLIPTHKLTMVLL